MHTTKSKNVSFVHDGDFSGEIYVVGKDRNGEESEVVLELGDLMDFVAKGIRGELTGLIESADVVDLMRMAVVLGVKFPSVG